MSRIDVQIIGDDLALIERVPSLLARCCGARTQSLSAVRRPLGWHDDVTGRLVTADVAAAIADAEERS